MNQVYSGVVVRQKNSKTVAVELTSHRLHPRYHKVIKLRSKIQAHNENFSLKIGEKVTIKAGRPYSATKRFLVISKENK